MSIFFGVENMFDKLYRVMKAFGGHLQSPFLLVIRLYWGYQFMITGFGKLLSLSGVANYFQTLGIPFPYLNAIIAGSVETIGGLLLLLGLYSRLSAIPLFFVMCVAYYTTGYHALVALLSEFNPDPFLRETPFLFMYTCIIVFIFGPGKASVDYWLTGASKAKEMP